RRSRWADELRTEYCGWVSPGWHVYRSYPQERHAWRLAGRAIEQVRAGHQRPDRQDVRPHRARQAARRRRRGDRVNLASVAAPASRQLLAQSRRLGNVRFCVFQRRRLMSTHPNVVLTMAMPAQLARGLAARRQSRSREQRPTVELLPAININDLRDAIPRDYSTNIYSNSLRYPQVRHIHLSYRNIKIVDHYDRVQIFGIEWIKTGLGASRAIFVCSCGYGAIRLFARYGTYACRHCHKAV